MARAIEKPIWVYLRHARPVEDQLELMLARAAADLRGALYNGPAERWKRRRIIRRHLDRLYRQVEPVIFYGEQQAAESAVRSMVSYGVVEDSEAARVRARLNTMSEENMLRLHTLLQGSRARVEAALLDRDVPDLLNPAKRGGVSYQIVRIARTEMNRTFHNTERDLLTQAITVTGARWKLSPTHVGHDLCDEYAARGVMAIEDIPDKPHPFCMCWIEPETNTTRR
jgi:hypothetical protein